jgi:predicted DNA-binding transcriptional regulator YafY
LNRAERIFRLHGLIKARSRSLEWLMGELEMSRATLNRDIRYMRDFMGAPIEYDRATNGYRYAAGAPSFELPGLWLNESELFALLATEQLLEQIQPGLLAPYIGPLRGRIRSLLAQSGHSPERVSERIRLQPFAARRTHPERFGTVTGALLERRRLRLLYHGRERDRESEREVHPQCLLRYRDNWYLVAYCETAGGARIFSLDGIRQVTVLAEPAADLDAKVLDRFLGASFGIFSGTASAWAVLRFSPEAARWVADEHWHPDQIGVWSATGYELQVPYSDPRELLRDILKYGPEVEVLAPAALRAMVAGRLRAAATAYENDAGAEVESDRGSGGGDGS